MSDLLNTVVTAAEPDLQETMTGLANQYLEGFQGLLEGAQEHVAPAVAGHLKKAAEYKWKALRMEPGNTQRAYVSGVADEIRSAKTILKSEGVAVTEEAAASFAAGFEKVLDAVGSALVSALGAVVKAMAAGAIEGLVSGEGGGLDLSGTFPGL